MRLFLNISDAHAVATFWLKMRAIITEASGTKVGLDTTDATSELLREAMTWADRAYASRVSRAAEAKREPDPVLFGLSEEDLASFVKQARSSLGRRNRETPIEDVAEQTLIGPGWVGEQPEWEWVAYVQAAVLRKVEKLDVFRPATQHDLLINDNSPVPAVNRRKVVEALSSWVRNLQRANHFAWTGERHRLA